MSCASRLLLPGAPSLFGRALGLGTTDQTPPRPPLHHLGMVHHFASPTHSPTLASNRLNALKLYFSYLYLLHSFLTSTQRPFKGACHVYCHSAKLSRVCYLWNSHSQNWARTSLDLRGTLKPPTYTNAFAKSTPGDA